MTEEYIGWLDDDWNTVLDQSQPIVRCRDCVCFNTDEPQGCTLFDFAAPNQADGFCAWGERKVVE